MLAKTFIVVLLVGILVALFAGAFFLLKDDSTTKNRRTVKALTWRVSLQLALIVFLVVAYFMGWIRPHAVTERTAPATEQTAPP